MLLTALAERNWVLSSSPSLPLRPSSAGAASRTLLGMRYSCAGLVLFLSCVPAALRAESDAAWAQLHRFAALEPAAKTVASQPVLPQASASDEQRVAAACGSPERILIIDNFLEEGAIPPYIDVDGDG